MPKATMEDGTDFTPQEPAQQQSPADMMAAFLSPVSALGPAGRLGSREEIERELDLIAAAVRAFFMKPADQVMRECSAYTARLTELAMLLHRAEGNVQGRQYTRIRTQQVERFLAELDRQWKTASRLIEVQRQDIEVLRGQR